MEAAELVSELENRGTTLQVRGDRIRFKPREAVPDDLLRELRAHKTEVMALLRSRVPVGCVLPCGVEPRQWPETGAETLAMPLSEFRNAGLVVEVLAHVFGATVVFASDNARLDPGERRVVYVASELGQLLGMGPEDIRLVHEIKRDFGGTAIPN